MTLLELHATASGDRLEMTARVRQALGSAGAWILGHQEFSNISLCIRFETNAHHLASLERELLSSGIQLDPASLLCLRQPAASSELAGSLQITFLHSEPDLRQFIPPIPG